MTHLLIIGSSDAGISAALRARELAPVLEITIVLSDRFPNFSGFNYQLRITNYELERSDMTGGHQSGRLLGAQIARHYQAEVAKRIISLPLPYFMA